MSLIHEVTLVSSGFASIVINMGWKVDTTYLIAGSLVLCNPRHPS